MKINPLGVVNQRGPNVHCGDLCGRGCSWDEFITAQQDAYRAEQMMPGWEGNVWENLGWHWSLVRQVGDVRWNLTLNRRGMWDCYSTGGGQHIGTVGFTPQEAVANAVNGLTAQIARTTRDLYALTGTQL